MPRLAVAAQGEILLHLDKVPTLQDVGGGEVLVVNQNEVATKAIVEIFHFGGGRKQRIHHEFRVLPLVGEAEQVRVGTVCYKQVERPSLFKQFDIFQLGDLNPLG